MNLFKSAVRRPAANALLTASLMAVAVNAASLPCSAQEAKEYGQPAGSALDEPMQTPAKTKSSEAGSTTQFGKPAGNALDIPGTPPILNPTQGSSPLPMPSQPTNGVQTIPASKAPPLLDLSSIKVSNLDLNLVGAECSSASLGAMHLTVNNLDVKNGKLSGLTIAAKNGSFNDIAFDELNIATQGDCSFDREQLLHNETLQFTTPVVAKVSAVVSQAGLNSFINSPRILQKLSVTAASKIGFLSSFIGSAGNIGVKLSDGSILLKKGNRVEIGIKAQVGMGSIGVPLPLSLDAKLGLNDQGWIALSETKLNANGQEISPLLSNVLVKHVNEMADWGKISPDIKFSFSELKVVPNKLFKVSGTAEIARFNFGQSKGSEPTTP